MLRIDIISLFPSMFEGPLDTSMLKKAKDKGLVEIYIHDLRHWGVGPRRTVDDRPFGGGAGMLLMIEPIYNALAHIKAQNSTLKITKKNSKVILLTPQGQKYSQDKAFKLSQLKQITLICGHYEGFDQRIVDHLIDEEISIGDYVLTGGELPAMVVADSVVRLIPEVLSKPEASQIESFSSGVSSLLEHPQYTRPSNFKGWKVPEVLQSGDHPKISAWQKEKAYKLTLEKRPDLLAPKKA